MKFPGRFKKAVRKDRKLKFEKRRRQLRNGISYNWRRADKLVPAQPHKHNKPPAMASSSSLSSLGVAAAFRPSPPSRSQLATRSASFSPKAMSSSLPENRIIIGCGGVTMDYLAAVESYPNPDDKIRSTSAKVQGGGNAGNALTCAARLGLQPRIISKIADDAQGKAIIEELEADGVDTSYLVVGKGGNTPFTYVIVDSETKTRTCIHTPGYPPLKPEELTNSNLLAAIDGARLAYFDVRLHETALVVAAEAKRRGIPILIDAEKKREGLDDLLSLSSYLVCSARFPQAWTEAPSIAKSLVSMLLKLPDLKFVIVTLGEDGCIMLERAVTETARSEEMDVDDLLETLKQKRETSENSPSCISSEIVKLHAKGIGTVTGRLLIGTAVKVPPSELIDTTGAGDAFIGATLYAISANMPPEKMLPFAAQVAAINCRALGARTGLPHRTDPRLKAFLGVRSQPAVTVA